MRRRATKSEARWTAESQWDSHCWRKSPELQELRDCRKLLRASNHLFSTSDTSTSKTGFSKPVIGGLVGTATQKSEHSTRLSWCKQEWRVANLGCFVTGYTTNCGISSLNPTTACDVSFVSLLPRNSHQVATIPANSCVSSLMDLRFSHQCSGSKSPSRALAIPTSMPCGNTRCKIYRARRV